MQTVLITFHLIVVVALVGGASLTARDFLGIAAAYR